MGNLLNILTNPTFAIWNRVSEHSWKSLTMSGLLSKGYLIDDLEVCFGIDGDINSS